MSKLLIKQAENEIHHIIQELSNKLDLVPTKIEVHYNEYGYGVELNSIQLKDFQTKEN